VKFGPISIFLWVIAGFLILEYVVSYFVKQIMIMTLKRKCAGKLILTYDDGPGPELEARLLRVLNEHGARATFFLNGQRADLFPGQCDLLMESGQELGYHCYRHVNAYRTAPWVVLTEVRKAYRVLEKWASRDRIFRPPHGKLTLTSALFLLWRGSKIIFWTVDSGDTHQVLPMPETIVRRVIEENGSVVLMHSFDRDWPHTRMRAEYVISLTEKLLMVAKEHGLRVCAVRDLNYRGRKCRHNGS
jgi:peptidoglycan/xylan/chitin deacetylase (PgdA/CDA1 family)